MKIDNLYDFTYACPAGNPAKVTAKVLCATGKVTHEVTLKNEVP